MIKVSIERSGLDVHVFAEEIDRRLIQPLIERLADRAEQIMREKAPTRTGMLRASIRKEVGEKEAVIGPTALHAIFIESGTRPHEIRPVHARALRFEVAGEVVFAARVAHPGTRPQPFIRETADQISREVPEIYGKVFEETIEE